VRALLRPLEPLGVEVLERHVELPRVVRLMEEVAADRVEHRHPSTSARKRRECGSKSSRWACPSMAQFVWPAGCVESGPGVS
jgi:hypothetical protein